MSISKRLYFIFVLFLLIFSVSIYGVLQVSKGADFHKFNVLHYEGSLRMYTLIQDIEQGDISQLSELEKVVRFVREQPISCLREVNALDKIIMKMIGTFDTYNICIADLKAGDVMLEKIERFHQNKDLPLKELIASAYHTQKTFVHNSNSFVEPVEKTVDFIILSMTLTLIIVSIFVAIALFFIIRSIKRTEERLYKYSSKLEVKTREAEDAREQAEDAREQAEDANRLKSEFLATMSHEIRTPMNGIFGMAELMMESEITNKQEYHLTTLMASADSLLTIIDDILDFSKIEAGKMELDPVEMNLHLLVDNVSELFSIKALEKSIEVIVRYKSGTPDLVFGDPVRLRQILTNLIGNSIKFTEQGYIFIEMEIDESWSSNTETNTAMYKISVHDTGIGIPQNKLDDIFAKFSQADGSTTRKFGGTGLGLAICKSLTEMMGGTIAIESEVGTGSHFTVSVPLQLRNTSLEANFLSNIDITKLKGLRVLAVDDLALNGVILQEYLNKIGVHCDNCIDAREVLTKMECAHASAQPYQIIMLDYLMPEINGIELARAIRGNANFKNTVLMMVTAAGAKDYGEEFSSVGFNAYVSKPLRFERLVPLLNRTWQAHLDGKDDFITEFSGSERKQKGDMAGVSFKNTHILLAEDNRINQAFAVEMLNNLGCKVDVAANGQEAINLLDGQDYDLILMDCQMPVMDGFEASQKISVMKTQGKLEDIPIVALTANAMKGDRERCIMAGMQDYLSKPVRKKGLLDILARWLPKEKVEGCMPDEEEDLGGNTSVLLVEDNRTNRMMAEGLLEVLGCDVEVAENGQIAVDKVKEKTFDVIFMDCQMPIMDGYTASRLIDDMRKEKTIANTPIIALTANALPEDRQRCMESGMDDFIAKPAKKSNLSEALKKWNNNVI